MWPVTPQGDFVFNIDVTEAEETTTARDSKMLEKFGRYLCACASTMPYASTLIMRDLGREGLWAEL